MVTLFVEFGCSQNVQILAKIGLNLTSPKHYKKDIMRRASQEEQNGAIFSFIAAPSSDE